LQHFKTPANIGFGARGGKIAKWGFWNYLGVFLFIWANVQGSPRLRQVFSVIHY
jgi:hypothetical protein